MRRQNLSLGSLLTLYFFLWSTLPTLLAPSFPLDVIEGINWGREWQLGYYKHPPLPSWLLVLSFQILGHIGPYLLSQLCIIATLVMVYQLGRHIVSPRKALTGSLLLMAVFYYTWPTLEFNHNIAQLPIWAGICLTFYHAWDDDRRSAWIGFGICAGLGLLTKYSVTLLLITLLLYSLVSKQRSRWLTLNPWLAITLMTLIFLPHLIWSATHDWLPFTYAMGRSGEAESSGGRLNAFKFLGTQAVNHLILMIMILICGVYRYLRRPISLSHDEKMLVVMAFGPALLTTSLGLLFGIGLRDMWGTPMWNYSGIVLLLFIDDADMVVLSKRLYTGLCVFLILITLVMILYTASGARLTGKPGRMHWPQVAISLQAQQTWQSLSHCPLDAVGGQYWLAGLITTDAKSQPSILIAPNAAFSPWMNAQRIESRGLLQVWRDGEHDEIPYLDQPNIAALATAEGIWQFAWPQNPEREPLIVHWRAYVPTDCRSFR